MRKELEDIIFLGKITDTVEILGKVWTLQIVDIVSYTNTIKQINTPDDNVNILILKKNIIQHALVSVDGVTIQENEREAFINALPFQVIDALWIKYNDMSNKFNGTLTPKDIEDVKN